MVHKEEQVNGNFNLTQITLWCICYNQYIQNKIKNKLFMKAVNYACFKLEEKITGSVKQNKNNQGLFCNPGEASDMFKQGILPW